jgi:hypothetical protein
MLGRNTTVFVTMATSLADILCGRRISMHSTKDTITHAPRRIYRFHRCGRNHLGLKVERIGGCGALSILPTVLPRVHIGRP